MSNPYPLEDEFGDIIKKARLGLALRPSQVAQQAAIDEEQLLQMEAYDLRPTQPQVQALAAALQLSARKLQAIADEQYVPPSVPTSFGDFRVHMLPGEPGEANCYIIVDRQRDLVGIVDPGVAARRIQGVLDTVRLPLAAILVTHQHGDHTKSLDTFAAQAEDMSLDTTIIPTPGHTEDSTTFYFPGFVMVGDLMFAGSVGRARTEPGLYRTHLQSLHRILALPDNTVIFPGHGPATTVASEKRSNPFFLD